MSKSKILIKIFGWFFIVSGIVTLAIALIYLIISTSLLNILVNANIDVLSFEKIIFTMKPFVLSAFEFLKLFLVFFVYSELGLSLILAVQGICMLFFGYYFLKDKVKRFGLIKAVLVLDLLYGIFNLGFGIFFPAFFQGFILDNGVWIIADLILVTTLFVYQRKLNNVQT